MNKHAVTFLLIALTALSCSSADPIDAVIGEWKGEWKGKFATKWTFKRDGNLIIVVADPETGEIKATEKGKYEFDFSQHPVWLDITPITKGKQQEENKEVTIFRFLTIDKERIEVLFSKSSGRPETFTEKNGMRAILQKVQTNRP